MRALGFTPTCFDDPPFDDFWLFEQVRQYVGGGFDIFGDKYPILWIYTIMEKILRDGKRAKIEDNAGH